MEGDCFRTGDMSSVDFLNLYGASLDVFLLHELPGQLSVAETVFDTFAQTGD